MIEVKRSVELEEMAAEARKRYRAGDDAWFEQRTGHGDVLVLGTAPGEEWRGREEVLNLTIARGKELNSDAGIVDEEERVDRVEGFEAGDTGWVVSHSSFLLDDGARVPIRGVAIFSRADGEWIQVFGESSVVVANELVKPGSPLAQS